MLLNRAFLIAVIAAGTGGATSVTYSVSVNTSALAGDSGYLDLQFNPGGVSSDPASAVVTGFASNGSLTGQFDNSGSVSGTLPGAVTIGNTGSYNDYNESFNFSRYLTFFVTLNVPTVSGTAGSGSSFALTLYQPDDATEYLDSSAPDLVEIDLDASGNPSVTNYSLNNEAVVSQTPEPGAGSLAASGLAAALMALMERPKRRR
jgi:hypothetical protein